MDFIKNSGRLHGFNRRDTTADKHLCSILLSNETVKHILDKIAKEYGDTFIWFSFSHTRDSDNIREKITLSHEDTARDKSRMEIKFFLHAYGKFTVGMESTTNTDRESGTTFKREKRIHLMLHKMYALYVSEK